MAVLALDTTTRAGSIAILRDGAVLVETTGDAARTHGERLPDDLHRALDAARIAVADLDLLAVVAGPGSFTGLRIGIAAMQGLAFARSLPIVPVSTFEALAALPVVHRAAVELVAPWVDAQRGEVFSVLYRQGSGEALEPPRSASPADTLAAWRDTIGDRQMCFAGDGAVRYRDVIASALGARAQVIDGPPPLAGAVAAIADRHRDRAVVPHAIVPIYVRRSDAELARDRREPPRPQNAPA